MDGPVDFTHLYRIGPAMRAGALHVAVVKPHVDIDAIEAGESTPTDSLHFEWDSGNRAFDLIGTTHATFLVSHRFVAALERVCASGYESIPVEISDRLGVRIRDYSLLIVRGRAGALERTRTQIIRVPPPVPQGVDTYEERGWYFSAESWDGSDLFRPMDARGVCVTDRVCRELKASKLTNVAATPLSEALVNIYSERPPGRGDNDSAPRLPPNTR